jgi:IclR family acetate operon transcriptional repressor
MSTTRGAPMSSAVRVLQICEALAEHQPVGVRELARVVDAPRSTVQRALETLEAAGWAVRTESGVWCLSSRPVLVGARAGVAGALRELARPSLERLQTATDESVRLWAREGAGMVIVLSLDSAQPVRYVGPPPGTVLPLHASAAGKAVLARLPADELAAILERPLESLTPRTVVDPRALRAQLDDVRARGFATTRHEARADVGGVAAAVVDRTGRPVGALSVTLPMHRLTDAIVEDYGGRVAAEATRLSTSFSGAALEGAVRP